MNQEIFLYESNYQDFFNYQVISKSETVEFPVPRALGVLSREPSFRKVQIPEQYIVEAEDVVLLPRQVIIKGDKVFPDTFRRGHSKFPHIQLNRSDDHAFISKLSMEPEIVINEPCFYFDGEHGSHFGHFLVEVMSRLWVHNLMDISSLLFVTSIKPCPYHKELLAPFGIKAEQIRYFESPVLCRKLYISSQGYVLENFVTQNALNVWDVIGSYYDDGTVYENIYVSRKNWAKQRNLINELVVQEDVESRGFHVVCPEMLSVPEQIRIFRNAKRIIGPSGSGMYNSIYTKCKGNRLILASSAFVTANDVLVNSRTNSDMTYITGERVQPEVTGMLADWSIDPDFVKTYLDTWL